MVAQRALGFAGRAAGVVQRGEIVGAGEAQRAGVAFDLDRLQEVDAIVGRPHGEDRLELARLRGELEGDARRILVNAANPGWVRTRMGGRGAPRSVEDGARTPVFLATLPDGSPTGRVFSDERPVPF